jgi:hypothetical protein
LLFIIFNPQYYQYNKVHRQLIQFLRGEINPMASDNPKIIRQSFGNNSEEWRLATLAHSAIVGVSLAATVELANSQALST